MIWTSVFNGPEVSNKLPMFRQGPGSVIELSEGFVDYGNPIATYATNPQIMGDLLVSRVLRAGEREIRTDK